MKRTREQQVFSIFIVASLLLTMCRAKVNFVEGMVGKYEGDVYQVLNDDSRTIVWCEIPKQTIRLGTERKDGNLGWAFRIPDGVVDDGACGGKEGQYFVTKAALGINGFETEKVHKTSKEK